MSKPQPLSPTEAAAKRGCSRQYIHQLLKKGRIKGAYRVGKQWAIPQPITLKDAARNK